MWDMVMAGAQVGLNLCLLPTVFRSTSYVPRFTSASTTVGLSVVALSLFNLGAPLGGFSVVVGVLLWASIFIYHGHTK